MLGWESVHACNTETFGGILGSGYGREVVLMRDLLLPRLMNGEVAL